MLPTPSRQPSTPHQPYDEIGWHRQRRIAVGRQHIDWLSENCVWMQSVQWARNNWWNLYAMCRQRVNAEYIDNSQLIWTDPLRSDWGLFASAGQTRGSFGQPTLSSVQKSMDSIAGSHLLYGAMEVSDSFISRRLGHHDPILFRRFSLLVLTNPDWTSCLPQNANPDACSDTEVLLFEEFIDLLFVFIVCLSIVR